MTVLKNIICVLLAFLSFALVRAAPLKDVIMPRQAPQGSYALRCNGGNLDMQAMVSCREHFWGKGDDVWFAFPGGVHLCGPNNGVFISGRAKHDRLKTAQATGYQIGYGIDQIFHQCGKRGGSVSVYYEAEHDHEFIVHVGDRWV